MMTTPPATTPSSIDWPSLFKTIAGAVITGSVALVAFIFTYKRTGRNAKIGARPILQLLSIDLSPASRNAVFKNDGGAQAHDLHFKMASGMELNAPSQVLGKGVEISIPIPQGDGIIDVSFKSTYDEEGQSICAYSELGLFVSSDQAYGSEIFRGAKALAMYGQLSKKAKAADVRKHLAAAGEGIKSMKTGN